MQYGEGRKSLERTAQMTHRVSTKNNEYTKRLHPIIEMNETMTKREQIAAMAMQGLCANPGGPFQRDVSCGWTLVNCTLQDVSKTATDAADALIAHLKRTTPRHAEYTLTPNRVEEMLAATIPGGSVADPQEIADAIREWFGYSILPPNDQEEPRHE